MNTSNQAEEQGKRSTFARKLIQDSCAFVSTISKFIGKIPNTIVQFWDNLDQLPADVRECIETWRKLEEQGFDRLLFDSQMARDFIRQKLGQRYVSAFDKCYHPAMQSDYFRLCYIYSEGGCYIDADDVYSGVELQHLFFDGRLKIQPLCYNMETNLMVSPKIFTVQGASEASWIFYFNNNPLIAGRSHPILKSALEHATIILENYISSGLPEIQSATGPGNLTKCIVDFATEIDEVEQMVLVLRDWEEIGKSKWELSYRNDARNWRLSNCKSFC